MVATATAKSARSADRPSANGHAANGHAANGHAAPAAGKSPGKPVRIALNLIKVDPDLQPRVAMSDDHWNRIARAYVEGVDLPPPVHVFDGGRGYLLVDGFHRQKAMWSLRHMGPEFAEILCFVHEGDRDAAVAYAATANLNNRSKVMSDLDRKKAMWMLLGLEEWRHRSADVVGKVLEISHTTSNKWWLEYFEAHNLEVPTHVETSNGVVQPATRRARKNPGLPAISYNGRSYSAKVKGKDVYLGTSPDVAEARVKQMARDEAFRRKFYGDRAHICNFFLRNHVLPESSLRDGLSNGNFPGIRAMLVRGVPVTWDSFANHADAFRAIGNALVNREIAGTARTVVLCPVTSGPSQVLEVGRKLGVEFLTIEEFVEGVKGGGSANGAGRANANANGTGKAG